MTKALKGKSAIVTGAAQGIGKAIASKLAEMGVRVAGVDCARQELERLREQITNRGGELLAFHADLVDENAIPDLIHETRRNLGAIDILINNAATMAPNKTVVETTSREWKRALDVNLRAPFLLAKGVIRAMAQRGGGTIVNIGSGGSEVGIPGRAAYCASKAGLVRFTESLAAEVRDLSIEVFCLEPRRIETAAAAEARSGGLELRPGRPPEEILPALLFLLSGRAGHLSGSNLHMDQVWLWSD